MPRTNAFRIRSHCLSFDSPSSVRILALVQGSSDAAATATIKPRVVQTSTSPSPCRNPINIVGLQFVMRLACGFAKRSRLGTSERRDCVLTTRLTMLFSGKLELFFSLWSTHKMLCRQHCPTHDCVALTMGTRVLRPNPLGAIPDANDTEPIQVNPEPVASFITRKTDGPHPRPRHDPDSNACFIQGRLFHTHRCRFWSNSVLWNCPGSRQTILQTVPPGRQFR